jgi:nucleotide-binding universal stress UspA family protein
MSDAETPPRPVRIVLYVDDSEHWHPAARLLGEFVRASGAGHVTVVSTLLLPGSRGRALEKARALLGLPEDQVASVGRAGILEYTLPDVARELRADVVVVGRLGSADRLTSGLIAHLVAKRTPASVLIARGRPQALRRILVCTEGARHGLKDFELASKIARAFGSRLDVLHVANLVGLTDKAREEIDEDLRDFVHSDAPEAEHLRELDARLRTHGLEGRIIVRGGLVVEEIVDAVREGSYDLLVIGAHDIGGPGAHLYEDFASLILRASPTSTLVVREKLRGPVNE